MTIRELAREPPVSD